MYFSLKACMVFLLISHSIGTSGRGGENNMANNNSNQLLVNGAQQAIDQMKFEIASEFGVQLGADQTSRANGSVGGEITKRLVQLSQQQLAGQFRQQ
jgi:hypothetical protein